MNYDFDYEYEDYGLKRHKASDTVKWVLTLIAFILVGVMIAGIICGWFDRGETPEEPVTEEQPEEVGGTVISDGVNKGVSLMRTQIASADFGDYGISPLAESAYTLTATLDPDDILDNIIHLSVGWTDPGDEWATDKQATDYVSLSAYEVESGNSVNVECLGEFGAQITITATSNADAEITATCTADYAQKVTELSLSFGDVTSGVKTNPSNYSFPVTWETGTDTQGPGGAANLDYSTSTAYTLEESFAVDISCSLTFQQLTTINTWDIYNMELTADGEGTALASAIEDGSDVYFDVYTFFDTYITPYGMEYPWGSMWNAGVGRDYFDTLIAMEDYQVSQYFSIYVTIDITGTYSDYTYTFIIYPDEVTYNPTLGGLNLSDYAFIF